MGSGIEWTQETWNPLTGCDKVSEGCALCYAEGTSRWQKRLGTEQYQDAVGEDGRFAGGEITTVPGKLTKPLRWTKPRRIFVNSVSDLFHEDVPFEFQCAVYAVMAIDDDHVFQVLTKRPENMKGFFIALLNHACERKDGHRFSETDPNGYNQPEKATEYAIDIACENYPQLEDYLQEHEVRTTLKFPAEDVMLGATTENQKTLRERLPHLLQCPGVSHWLSCEPIVGPVSLGSVKDPDYERNLITYYPLLGEFITDGMNDPEPMRNAIDWVVVGGESKHDELSEDYYPQPRPMHPEWAENILQDCLRDGAHFFFKQWGAWRPVRSRIEGQENPDCWLQPDGTKLDEPEYTDGERWMVNLGKDETGNNLDGETFQYYPDILKRGAGNDAT